MIPSTVVQTVQTSAMGADVIASFRNILSSKELTVLVWKVGVAGYWSDLALCSDNRKTHLLTIQLSFHAGTSSESNPFEDYARWK